MLKRLVGVPVRGRPLEFAAEALEARSEPLQLLLDTLTVRDRPGKLRLQPRPLATGAPLKPSCLPRPLRPLEFAAEVLEARSEPLKLLLQGPGTRPRIRQLARGVAELRLKLTHGEGAVVQLSLHAIALGHSLRRCEGAPGVAELLFGSAARGLRIADLLAEALPPPPGVVQLRAPRGQLSSELCDTLARLVELLGFPRAVARAR